MVSAELMKKYEGYIQTFAAFISDKRQDKFEFAKKCAKKLDVEMQKAGIIKIIDRDTLIRAKKTGFGGILSIENAGALAGSEDALDKLYELGFRAMSLTWNGKNELGSGAVSENSGLSHLGKAAVVKLNEKNIAVDVSHLSEQGFWELMEITNRPPFASHSNSKAICNQPRNLTDEQIKAIFSVGGVVGINVYPEFLCEDKRADTLDVVKHMMHLLELGGEDFVGLGTDFDGITKTAEGVENAGKLYKIFDELKKQGCGDVLIEKISHKNFQNYFFNILK